MAEAKKQRKERVTFTLAKDIFLLRGALDYNPWQLGDDFWKELASDMKDTFHEDFTVRTVKDRVHLLVDKYNKKQLKYSSGTEKEMSERGQLLKTIIEIKQEENVAINNEITPENDQVEGEIVSRQANPANAAKERKLERLLADKERAFYADDAPGPNESSAKRQRISVEDEILMEKHKHEIKMEKDKVEIERLRIQSELKREDQRLHLERQREERLKEESLRHYELAKAQLELQNMMMEVMKKFLEK